MRRLNWNNAFVCLGLVLIARQDTAALAAAPGHALVPISGADGVFETRAVGGQSILRAVGPDGNTSPFVYLRLPERAPRTLDPAFVEVTYRDSGTGPLRLEYNAEGNDYRAADQAHGVFLGDRGGIRTAVFRLPGARFRGRMNLEADLRLATAAIDRPFELVNASLFDKPTRLFIERESDPLKIPYDGETRGDVDAASLDGKVLCGYQGWFRCPGDPADQGWRHWSRDGRKIDPATLTFEMWPEVSGLSEAEKYPAPGFSNSQGPASLFSSDDPRTVERHFRWMQAHGIDGVLVQRFLVNVEDRSFDRVLAHVRDSAHRTGRVFAVGYDLSGMPASRLVETLSKDWGRLVEEAKLTSDARYLRHAGKPVVLVWGFFPDRFDAKVAHGLIDLFKRNDRDRATLIGGVPWYWSREKDPEWSRALRRFDVISPWNVGNVRTVEGEKHASTAYWPEDIAVARNAGMAYLPVIWPGFGWTNLKGKGAEGSNVPRLRGRFFSRQFAEAARLGMRSAYVAMFDEVDEGTAIMPVSNDPPSQGRFLTFEGLPPDHYLKLTGEGAKTLRSAGITPR